MKKTIVSLLLFFISQLLGTLVAIIIVTAIKFSVLPEGSNMMSAFSYIVNANLVVITLWGLIISQILLIPLLWKIKYTTPKDLVKPVPLKLAILSIILVITGVFALNMINTAVGFEDASADLMTQISTSRWALLSIGLFGPVVEETIFRRIMIDELWTKWGKPWLAIVISAVIFGLVHMNPAQSFFAVAIGILFGWVYVRTGSIMPCVVAHMLNNIIGVVEMRILDGRPDAIDTVPFYESTSNLIYLIAFIVVALAMIWFIGRIPSDVRNSRRYKEVPSAPAEK